MDGLSVSLLDDDMAVNHKNYKIYVYIILLVANCGVKKSGEFCTV